MRAWWAVRAWVEALVFRRRENEALDEEVAFHLDMETRKLVARGVEPAEARRRARIRFGGEDRMKERARDARGSEWLPDLLRDLRLGGRFLRRTPAFTLTTFLTLALGIGATTAMFTLVDTVLIRPLPYPEPDRLVDVREVGEDGSALLASYANFSDWRAGSGSFSALAAVVPPRPATLLVGTAGVRASVTQVSADFFEVAGVRPLAGRVLDAGDHATGAPLAAVVSHAFWRGPLGAPDDLEGVVVSDGRAPVPVVGVMPPTFDLPEGAEVWISLDREVPWTVRGNHVVEVVGRTADGVDEGSAGADLTRVHEGLGATYPEVETVAVRVEELKSRLVSSTARPLALLLAASGVLLLVACTNAGGAFLARGVARRSELAVRASLGAGRGRLLRQLTAETALLGGAAALGGLVVAHGVLSGVRGLAGAGVPRLAEVGLDLRVALVGAAVGLATGLVFGLAPALRLTTGEGATLLRTGARGGDSPGMRRLWRGLLVAEVALSLVLLAGAALLARSMGAIADRDLGYRPEGVVTARFHLPQGRYDGYEAVTAGLDGFVAALESDPRIDDAGVGLLLPVAGSGDIAGPVGRDGGDRTEALLSYRVADPGWFETLGIPLVAGRLFGPDDGPEGEHVAVVDESMARLLWPGQDPLGRRFEPGGMDPWPDRGLTVVGVVGDVRSWDEEWGRRPTYYVSSRQRPAFLAFFGGELVVRGRSPGAAAAALRETIRRLDPSIPVTVRTLDERLAGSVGQRRLAATVFGAFAGLALLLASVGIYGLVSWTAGRRRREMGVRVALGASPRAVRVGLQGEVLGAVTAGTVVGLVLALLLGRTLESLLFGVGAADPASLGVAGACLVGAAWAASWLPARRSASTDPAAVLRQE